MMLTWWGVLIILLGVFFVGLIAYGYVRNNEALIGFCVCMFIVHVIFGWGFAFGIVPVKSIEEESKYIYKFVTNRNVIIELPNGSTKTLTNIKYLTDSIKVFKITQINTYNDTTITYKVK